jgi:hypothetical protein
MVVHAYRVGADVLRPSSTAATDLTYEAGLAAARQHRVCSQTHVRLCEAGAGEKLQGNDAPLSAIEDVNADGYLDVPVHVSTEELQLTATASEAVLVGMTSGHKGFRGKDTVKIVS